MRAAVFQGCSSDSGTWQIAWALEVAEEIAPCSNLQQHRPRGARGGRASPLPLLHLSIPIYLEQGIGKNSSSQQGRGRNRVPNPLEHLWNKAEHWNRPEGHPLGDKPQGGGVEQIAPRGRFAPMSPDQRQDGQEQVVVESNSGRRYFVPRETVERLFRLCPSQAAALVARVSTLREPLEPPGCPSGAFSDRGRGCMRNP